MIIIHAKLRFSRGVTNSTYEYHIKDHVINSKFKIPLPKLYMTERACTIAEYSLFIKFHMQITLPSASLDVI